MLRLHLFLCLVTPWRREARNLLPDERDTVAGFTMDDLIKLTLAHPAYAALFRNVLALAQCTSEREETPQVCHRLSYNS